MKILITCIFILSAVTSAQDKSAFVCGLNTTGVEAGFSFTTEYSKYEITVAQELYEPITL